MKDWMAGDILKTADLSADGKYRWSLTRRWSGYNVKPLVYIMLNPSTANAFVDDATIRKCIGFAKLWGYNELEVVNLFPYRATDPKVLKTMPRDVLIPQGADERILEACAHAGKIVAAWGVNGGLYGRDKEVEDLIKPHVETVWAHKLSKNGCPEHPLYQRYDRALEVYFGRMP